MTDLQCLGRDYRPGEAPEHSIVREAIRIIKLHLDKEWISEGCKADHAFGCASCQALLLSQELDGLAGWLDDLSLAPSDGDAPSPSD
jgi:hypothetical protein